MDLAQIGEIPRAIGAGTRRLQYGSARYLAGPLLVICVLAGGANAQPGCDAAGGPASNVPGQLCVDIRDGLVSIQSQDVGLQQLLDEIARRSALLVFADQPLDSLVSVQCEELELQKALQRILRNRNYMLIQVKAPSAEAYVLDRSRSTLWILSDGEMGDGDTLPNAGRASSIHDANLEGLRNQLTSDHLRTRKNAIKILGRLEAHQAIPALTYALTDDNKEIRFRAIQALAGFEADDVATALAIATGDEHPGVRAEAAHWLGSLGGENAIRVLEQTLHDPDSDVRETTVKAFARIGGQTAVRLLQRALDDPNADVRQSAEDGLAELSGR